MASLACRAYRYNIKKIDWFVSKHGNTDFEDNTISIAQDEHFSTSQNSINNDNCNCSSINWHTFDNFEASISHDNSIQISWQENTDNENDDIQSILESFNKEAPSEYSYCHNCNWSQNRTLLESYGNDFPYMISLSTHSTLHIHRRRRFQFLSSTTNESNAEELHYVTNVYIIENNCETANKNKFVWPSFTWYLSNLMTFKESMVNKYGVLFHMGGSFGGLRKQTKFACQT